MGPLLRLTDPPRHALWRLALELARTCRRAAGTLEGLGSRCDRISAAAERARRLAAGSHPGTRTRLDALEEAAARLQKTFRDMTLCGAGPDPAAADALLDISEALTLLAGALSGPGAGVAPPAAGAKAAAAGKTLRLAAKGARSDPRGFIANLKFCTIYSELEKAAGAVENCVSLPAREV